MISSKMILFYTKRLLMTEIKAVYVLILGLLAGYFLLYYREVSQSVHETHVEFKSYRESRSNLVTSIHWLKSHDISFQQDKAPSHKSRDLYLTHMSTASYDPHGIYSSPMYTSRMSPKYSKTQSLLQQGISNILTNNYSLQLYKAFNPESLVNVWDLYPPEISCPDLKRIGRVGDGGKWICGLSSWIELLSRDGSDETYVESTINLNALNSVGNNNNGARSKCVVYSFGISVDSSFEEELLLTTDCTIYGFDPSIGSLPKPNIYSEEEWHNLQRHRIFFHKAGLSEFSGKLSILGLVQSINDIMYQYNHTFIDILKIDVEGAEWEIFKHLFPESGPKDISRRVGQLLIELHYDTMPHISSFFRSMTYHGFLSYSREINLNPTMSGGLPEATEYSFLNPSNILFRIGQSLSNVDVSLDSLKHVKALARNAALLSPDIVLRPPPKSPEFHDHVNACIYVLTQHRRVKMVADMLHQLFESFLNFYPQYPVLIFHDDLSEADEAYIKGVVPLLRLDFISFRFQFPKNVDPTKLPNRTICAPGSSTIGYRHMCRFHSTVIHDLLIHSSGGRSNDFVSSSTLEHLRSTYKDLEYILRVDDDSEFPADIGYDLFKFMKVNKKKYGYVSITYDDPKCVTNLWNLSRAFYEQLQEDGDISHGFFDQIREPDVFYNNFELSHTSLWRHPTWRSYMDFIDAHKGIYELRWGDAPIHTIGVSLVLSTDEIHSFTDIGYRHAPFINQNSSGLPMPGLNPIEAHYKHLKCIFYSSWYCYDIYGNFTNSTNSTAVQLDTKTPSSSSNAPTNVLFTFGHSGRENALSDTLLSFENNYAGAFNASFVVFYNKDSPLDLMHLKARLKSFPTFKGSCHIVDRLRFIPVKLKNFQHTGIIDYDCTSDKAEVRGASYFLRFQAFQILHSLGFEWFWRFADDSSIKSKVDYNVFESLIKTNKRYGYVLIFREHKKCVENIWAAVNQLCKSLASDGYVCGEWLEQWPPYVAFFNNFEISHISVWQSVAVKRIQKLISSRSHTFQSSVDSFTRRHHDRSRTHQRHRFTNSSTMDAAGLDELGSPVTSFDYTSDAAIHTLCVLTSMLPDEVVRLDQIEYSARIPPRNITNLSAANGQPISRDPRLKLDRRTFYSATSNADLNKRFSIRSWGWMGGDIAASFYLPDANSTLMESSRKYVWLFGDTLIGTFSGTQRLNPIIICNSVGIASMQAGDFLSLDYFWGNNEINQPTSTFEMSPSNNFFRSSDSSFDLFYGHQQGDKSASVIEILNQFYLNAKKFWPFNGISIKSSNSVQVVIIGQCVTGSSKTKKDATTTVSVDQATTRRAHKEDNPLFFDSASSAIVLVPNPHDPPNIWRHEHAYFPSTTKCLGLFQWFALSDSSGNSYVDDSIKDSPFLYVLGSYDPKPVSATPSDTNSYDFFAVDSADTHQVIGRISASNLTRFNFFGFEVLCNDNTWKSLYHGVDPIVPKALFGPLVTEASFHFDFSSRKWLVVSLRPPDSRVQLCSADAVDAAWVCEYVADLPEPWSDTKKFLTYAAKHHPELSSHAFENDKESDRTISTNSNSTSAKGIDLVVSIIPNSAGQVGLLFEESEIGVTVYTPKFMNIKSVAKH